MKYCVCLFLLFFLFGCQPQKALSNIYIIDGDKYSHIQTDQKTPSDILAQAGIDFHEADKILYHGADLPADFILPAGGNYSLQILRAHSLTLITPKITKSIQTTAQNVGQALMQNGLNLQTSDFVFPPLETAITTNLTITYRPSKDIMIIADGKNTILKSSQDTVGNALASAGIALTGLDKSIPGEDESIPEDGQIRITRIFETVTLQDKTIPFSNMTEYSSELPAGKQKVIQSGEPGLIQSRVRTRYEDGVQVSQLIETETIVREPKENIISFGTQVQIQSVETPFGKFEYWRSVQMYTTSYSPCRSGTSKCSYGTASGLPVKRGIVAVIPSLFNQLAGSRVYIPDYGVAVIGDVGGGFPDGRNWIDLGFSDEDFQNWSGMHTVYFLAPAPETIPAGLN